VAENYKQQFEQFCTDVAGHRLVVVRDDGLYRHLRCSANSYVGYFSVITWPGYLCYVGDMGCFVFSRLPDMFEFFRGRRTAEIDRGYLAEKAVAVDKPDGLRVYSQELFVAAVTSDFQSFCEDHELSADKRAELWSLIEYDVLSHGEQIHDAIDAAIQFRWAPDHVSSQRGRVVFPDFWEHRLEVYTARFWWCCYAIPWAIEQYDAQAVKSTATDVAADPQEAAK
jgi:hypothetical protein